LKSDKLTGFPHFLTTGEDVFNINPNYKNRNYLHRYKTQNSWQAHKLLLRIHHAWISFQKLKNVNVVQFISFHTKHVLICKTHEQDKISVLKHVLCSLVNVSDVFIW